jgi:hypothetical protein
MGMRAITFIIAIACIFLTPAAAAAPPSQWCFGVFGIFPVDIIDCKDHQLGALHVEAESLYVQALSRAKGRRKQALSAERNSWLINRGVSCGVPLIAIVTDQAVRAARPCLTRLYKERITELSKLLMPALPPSEDQVLGATNNNPGKKDQREVTIKAGESPAVAAPVHITLSELDSRMKYWETRLPFCTYTGGPPFPAKDQENGTPCNDGDSVPLNGLNVCCWR